MTSRLLLGLIAITSVGGAVAACGSASKTTSSPARMSSGDTTIGGATASTTGGAATSLASAVDPDHDDHITEGYGREASEADRRTITAVVKSYFATAAAGDGSKACSMIVSSLARGIPEAYGRSPGPPSLRGRTCRVVMSKLFKQSHRLLTTELATMAVTKVRTSGDGGLVFLAFGTTPEPRDIGVEREGRAWKISGLLDNKLP